MFDTDSRLGVESNHGRTTEGTGTMIYRLIESILYFLYYPTEKRYAKEASR